ncbi:DUF2306 domain-containing protein [Rhodovulum sp. 12E13]|uniref:DUF2306 domain-containing protein n=1 Tax=Rhodovulum sp. 12E13 TaxID=2203891 RepID=UPI000E17384D|nr:DUF2306 domain-containing protein [Rhodovulum sp. 12E13]RDC73443.1 DUF2306 domain-containing protein [Rhodovulum sp. 12E13]
MPSPVPSAAAPRRPPRRGAAIALALLALMAAPFARHAAELGWAGLTRDLWPESRFDPPGVAVSAAIFLHMATGAAITVLAPLQLVPQIRARAPALHRLAGRIVVCLSLVTAAAGLAWIGARGTIGGPEMSVAFALYGALLALAAAQTWRFARAGAYARHRTWALRLVVLAIASWLYRVQYGIWYAATGGIASTPDFTDVFDRVQVWAFFLPWLALLELWLWHERRRGGRAARA